MDHPRIHPEFPFGGGGRRERIFASGDLKFAVLHLLGQKPAHGYEIIKAMGELVGGDYTPSPGTIYPTLAMLEDLGWVVSTPQDGGRKEYRISAEGQVQLEEHREVVERILEHLAHTRTRAHGRRQPEIVRAVENLKTALRLRLGDEPPDPAVTRRISEIIDRAAVEIERCCK
ncbi:MAG: PadR family transcriptional regulator [Candidatus Accumulibacter sp.]|jgi:DNA-binding PadR family transcriptional regulator|nr:PadR family transcriptional regulator [Accumulibacter sp.]